MIPVRTKATKKEVREFFYSDGRPSTVFGEQLKHIDPEAVVRYEESSSGYGPDVQIDYWLTVPRAAVREFLSDPLDHLDDPSTVTFFR